MDEQETITITITIGTDYYVIQEKTLETFEGTFSDIYDESLEKYRKLLNQLN